MTESVFILGQQTSWLEIAAMLTGILAVWLTAKKNILCFPTGIVNVALYAILFFSPEVKLYADGILQVIYLVLLAYGWKNWIQNKNEEGTLPVKFADKKFYPSLLLLFLCCSLITGYLFHRYTSASFPYLDSSLTVLSLIAQWMIARKWIDNWYLWMAADIVYIPMYYQKGLMLTAVLYFIFLILCFIGYADWKKELHGK